MFSQLFIAFDDFLFPISVYSELFTPLSPHLPPYFKATAINLIHLIFVSRDHQANIHLISITISNIPFCPF